MKYFPILLATVLFMSCSKEETTVQAPSPAGYPNLPNQLADYTSLHLPTHWLVNAGMGNGPQTSVLGIDNSPSTNPITDAGATLGRVLFYDKHLSKNGTIACASCHKQDQGFSDNQVLSLGFEGGTTRRHSMQLINARYYARGRFFWDERAATLEDQVLKPFQDEVEMGLTLTELIDLVQDQPYYASLFADAFGDTEINADRISKALAQFVRSIVSYQSKYDVGRATAMGPGAPFANFSTSENDGKSLFFRPVQMGGAGCAGCHSTEAFIAPGAPKNNGLDAASTTDLGAGEVFAGQAFTGAFKVGSLRNIALTAPYMHDGRFSTLEEVVEHYNSGIQNHPSLDPALRGTDGQPLQLNLTSSQKTALVDFLKTLTDPTVATEEKWSDPF